VISDAGNLPGHKSTLLSVAPMMDRTDRHCRYFMRLLAPDVRLYTEMVVDQALLHGNAERLLRFDPREHPVALQLGGSEPEALASAAKLGEQRGYDEINLNIGCPSDRVQSGKFGACLMLEAAKVASCVAAIREVVDIPVTLKTRIGVDDHEDYDFLRDFVLTTAAAGCGMFIVHARKAILAGLSPKENRTIPPLRYSTVYRLKREFPELRIVINGGIRDSRSVREHLGHVDGVMIGREAYSNPYWLVQLQTEFLDDSGAASVSREAVLAEMEAYASRETAGGERLSHITRHMLGLYAGQPGARNWRRYLSEAARGADAPASAITRSLEALNRSAQRFG
jgi:tRNA-dihydrouridine synthase A